MSKQQAEAAPPEALSFAGFLESTPPSQSVKINPIAEVVRGHGTAYGSLLTPEIQLHCSNNACNGLRFFRFAEEEAPILRKGEIALHHITYLCSNCRSSTKSYSLKISLDASALNGECYKLGEFPTYGPPTSARLITLIGPDRDIFLKGRRCENQGLGIGAFVYYRRAVENQKNRILDEVIKVSEKVHASQDALDTLAKAKEEVQFSKALDSVKHAIPQSLLINGHNPLTLLHSALSDGLHAQTDEHCLEIAQAVRTVLAELSERIGQALKDEAELSNAVTRLMHIKSGK